MSSARLSTSGIPQAGTADARRHLALWRNFFKRELMARYHGSITGLAWALLHPLALLGVYHFVFTQIFRTTGFGEGGFLPFVAVALWPWLAAQEGLQRGTTALASYAGLIKKVAFPHEIIVYASVAATFALHFAGYLAVLVVLAAFGAPIHFEGLALAVPLWILLLLAVVGLALALAAIQVFVRDVEHLMMPVLMIVMYLTPILYAVTFVPERYRPWVAANPFAWLVERLRSALLQGNWMPDRSDAAALVIVLAVFFLGRAVFRRLSPYFEDFV